MTYVRPLLLLLLFGAVSWFEFAQPRTAHALFIHALDSFDHRPAHKVLILGNSRTFYHEMPDMIRGMADSAGDPQRYDITTEAEPGASLETLWVDPKVRDLVREHWDDVIVQGESRAQSSDEQASSFQTYGARLIEAARPTAPAVRLVVNWNYDARLWDDGDPDGSGRNAYYTAVQSASQSLSERTGAKLANIGQLWAQTQRSFPKMTLTEDGNHPTLAGSYLFALLLYGDLSKRDVGQVSYVPSGLDVGVAASLRQEVREYEEAKAD
ncbi:DUF4886 domain-containing protein [Sphingomonas bacterium]|uniref:DUF4886 domain-containing protein n=1 Tax=Sphingomonas bacterium TaxID=1895847 RepID=UPI001575E5D5|nr:DUF4886 domain-containing protein [Sphingomonas bacterium]